MNSETAGITALAQPVQLIEESFHSCAQLVCFDGHLPLDSYLLFFFKYGDRILEGNLPVSIRFCEKRAD